MMNISRYAKIVILLPIICVFSIFGCAGANSGYVSISAKEAKQIMDAQKDYAIVDVREPSEYNEGHVANALLLPLGTVERDAEKLLKNKEQLLLVYCRSGRRSKLAAEKLVKLGYSNVKEFGGILDWPYGVVR